MMKRIRPVGYRVLVQPEKVEETSKGGIIIASDVIRAEQNAMTQGKVLEVSPIAYLEFREKGFKPFCKEGDVILYQRYSGMRPIGDDGKPRDDLLILNDMDVVGVIEEA